MPLRTPARHCSGDRSRHARRFNSGTSNWMLGARAVGQSPGTTQLILANGSLAGRDRESALTYFSEREVNKLGFKAIEERKLRLRELDAAKTSATAAVDSARHAKDAATWARWAVVVAAIALIVSAWPYIVCFSRRRNKFGRTPAALAPCPRCFCIVDAVTLRDRALRLAGSSHVERSAAR
jgi:hypothetical protein